MPELAEVEWFRKQWDPGLGQKITSVSLHEKARIFRGVDLKALRRALEGARVAKLRGARQADALPLLPAAERWACIWG